MSARFFALVPLLACCSTPPVPSGEAARPEVPESTLETTPDPPIETAERAWHQPMAQRSPASKASAAVVATLEKIDAELRETKYHHITRVNLSRGIYLWDCSGMADWVLARAAPIARRAVRGKRPLARDFYHAIAQSPLEGQRRGWSQLGGPEEICPGDVYAWLKPDIFRNRKNTGHVGFVVSTPQPHPRYANVWVMQIADATRILHENDSRPEGGDGGYGKATMAFLFHASGAPMAYGWYGSRQRPQTFVHTEIAFGRAHR